MTPFPAPPAAAVADALEKAKTAEWIDEVEALNLSEPESRKIYLAVYRYLDRPAFRGSDERLRLALLPWARSMAGLFRIFPLASFDVVIRSSSCPIEGWKPPQRTGAALDSGRLWKAQRMLERELVRFLVREHGDTGFSEASLVIRHDDTSPNLFVRLPSLHADRTAQASFAPVQDWLRAMRDWLHGIKIVTFRLEGRPLSAHERLEILRRTDVMSNEGSGRAMKGRIP